TGRDYDGIFGWSDDRIYCSELVWKLYDRAAGLQLGKLTRLGDFNLEHPVVKKKLRERYGSRVPLDEIAISPGTIFDDPRLETVYSR
ncbi:MAG: YiiX/YebB-like N1pC/P60 family cysteine hydrolase, partial [Myxococcota bacterium]|nr:YiiX/YebB-like N1pC/P60 family cysteine hydrolase [Myxococcota bacterium]